jgi:transmembrane sensor
MMSHQPSNLERHRIQCEAVYWDWRLTDPELPVEEWIRFTEWHSISAHREMLDVVAIVRAQQRSSPPNIRTNLPTCARVRLDLRRLLVRVPVVAVILAVLFPNIPSPYRIFQTDDTPQARLLKDGSTVRAAPNTRVDIQFGRHYRSVHLLKGEALFHVAHDPSRPFLVRTPAAVVQALGTSFVVSIDDDESVVAVLEGSVAVTLVPGQSDFHPSQPTSTRYLGPSEQLRVSKHGIRVVPHTTDAMTPAWATIVSFSQTPIIEAVEQFNLRSGIRIELMHPGSVGTLCLSGAFQLDSPEAFAGYIAARTSMPVQLHRPGSRVQMILPPVKRPSE